MTDLCPDCRHPMSAHETLDHAQRWDHSTDPPTPSFEPNALAVLERAGLARYTTVCTQGRLASVDASPWDHVCGCVWSHDHPPKSGLRSAA